MIARVGAAAATTVIAAVIAFQLAIVLGAPWGELTQGGGTDGQLALAGRIIAAISAGVLAIMAAGLLARVGWGPLARAPNRVIAAISWFTVAYSALAVLLNAASPSDRERILWVPVSVILLACALATVLPTRAGRAQPS